MTTVMKNCSPNAKIALENGENILSAWTKETIISEIDKIFASGDIGKPEANLKLLERVDEKVLQECLLKRTAWHHVNHDPAWFYKLDFPLITTLTRDEMSQMLNMTQEDKKLQNKPKPVWVEQTTWVRFGDHQSPKKKGHWATRYNDYVYFSDGQRKPIRRGETEIANYCKKNVVKKNAKMFNNILNSMRKNYNLAV